MTGKRDDVKPGWRPLSAVGRGLKRAAREPLLQFLAAALALFIANSVIHGPDRGAQGDVVDVSEGRVKQIAESYRLLAGRMPSRAELEALVEDFIDEEVDYREAIAMGLDAEDTIVRRRMRQKLEFLVEDADASEEPSDADLSVWLKSHAEDYRLPGRVAIRQVLASGDRRGSKAAADASRFLVKLKAGADPASVGDPSMLPAAMPLTSEQGVAALFGDDFARAAFTEEGKGWFGPVASPFGQHLVLVMEREPGRDATLDDVRDKLRSDWIEAKRSKKRDDFQARLRSRYQVKISWPEPYLSQPAPTPDELARERARRPAASDNMSGE
jgi:hypothetical protein